MVQFTIDLAATSSAAFGNLIEQFEKWKQEAPPAPFTLTTGIHTITPEQAEELLKRNRKNRSVDMTTVQSYAVQLMRGEWKITGQPVIFTEQGNLLDGQHRLWASYLSGIPITTFVVTNIPDQDNLFAYVDNCRPRSAGDALQTAGLNGLAKHVAAVIQDFAHRHDEGALGVSGRVFGLKLSNREVLGYMQEHPELMDIARYMDQMHKQAKAKLGASITTFLAWKIEQVYGRETVDEFFHSLIAVDLPNDHPVTLLRKYIEPPVLTAKQRQAGYTAKQPPVKTRLAMAIAAFNAVQAGQRLKKLQIDPVNSFVINEPVAKAA